MLNNKVIEKLIEMGFVRWTKGGFDRLYANEKAIGLSVSRYNTGNVSYAELNGEKISNGHAREILYAIESGLYIDITTGEVHTRASGKTGGAMGIVTERIEEAAEACRMNYTKNFIFVKKKTWR